MSSSRRSRIPSQRTPIGFTPANRLRGLFSTQQGTFLHTPSKSAAQVRGGAVSSLATLSAISTPSTSGLTLGNVLWSFKKSEDKYQWLENARGALVEPNAWETVSEGQLKAFAEVH